MTPGDMSEASLTAPILFDTDCGIDDALALIYLSRRANLVGVGTVGGNVPVARSALNVLRVQEQAGLEPLPVAPGAHRPLLDVPHGAAAFHGQDGLGDAGIPEPVLRPSGEHAVAQLLRLAHEYAGELELVCTGPLTNLALALRLDAGLPDLLARVTVMGGAFTVAGNAAPVAEANMAGDPEAAAIVYGAGLQLTAVGLDVTMATRLEPVDIDRLDAGTSASAKLVTAILAHYLRVYSPSFGGRSCPLHDPLTAVLAVHPEFITRTLSAPVEVELHGRHSRGMTVADRRGREQAVDVSAPRPTIVLGVDRDAAVGSLLAALLD